MAAKLCNVCNTRRVYTGTKGTETAPHLSEMCNYCFEEGGHENTHSDYGHDRIAAIVAAEGTGALSEGDTAELSSMETCWICNPKLNLAQQAKGTTGTKKTQGTRRPQLNHKGHSHPATPAARRACKLAFWASLTPVVNVSSNEQLAAVMQVWDHSCDGFGKVVVKETKPASWTVVPRGPKGGVINQLKASKTKK